MAFKSYRQIASHYSFHELVAVIIHGLKNISIQTDKIVAHFHIANVKKIFLQPIIFFQLNIYDLFGKLNNFYYKITRINKPGFVIHLPNRNKASAAFHVSLNHVDFTIYSYIKQSHYYISSNTKYISVSELSAVFLRN